MYNSLSKEHPISSDLSIVATHGFSELERRLRGVTLKDNPNIHPYLRSKISLKEVAIAELHPCALYVLEENLARVSLLREEFLKRGIDIFHLTTEKSIINYDFQGRLGCSLAPPIVEVSEDDNYFKIITDGLHRVSKARDSGEKTFSIVQIENVAVPLPALPVSWNEVDVCKEVPPSDQKRRYRFNTPEEIKLWQDKNIGRLLTGLPVRFEGDLSSQLWKTRDQTRGEDKYAPWDFPG